MSADSDRERTLSLLGRFLEQELSESEQTEFETILSQSEEARREFLTLASMHQELFTLMERPARAAAPAPSPRPVQKTARRARSSVLRRSIAPLGLAAAVLLGLTAVVIHFATRTTDRPAKEQPAPRIVDEREPEVPAEITRKDAPPSPKIERPPTPAPESRPHKPVEPSSEKPQAPETERPKREEKPAPPPPVPDRPEKPPTVTPPVKPTVESALARLVRIEGQVRYSRGGRAATAKATEGISFLPGDRLDTRTGRARLDLPGGASIYADRGTGFRLLSAVTESGDVVLVELTRGEIYVSDGAGRVHVETLEGVFEPMGTRFGVRRSRSSTVVQVEEGAVRARSKRGGLRPPSRKTAKVDLRQREWAGEPVEVAAGKESRVRRGTSPVAPVRMAAGRLASWRSGLLGGSRGPVTMWIEAESGILAPPMEVASDSAASGEKYVSTRPGQGRFTAGFIEFTLDIPQDGDYVVWGRVMAFDSRQDSFLISMDDLKPKKWEILETRQNWKWDPASGTDLGPPDKYALKAGIHTLKIHQAEEGAKIDRILVTNGLKYVPRGRGPGR